MIQRNFPLPALLAMALAACQQPANDSNIAIDNAANPADVANAEVETLPPSESGGAPDNATASHNEGAIKSGFDADVASIPAFYRGRWGLVPADCTSTRGDAKGLITVSDTSIRFYEATATLKERRPAIATAFSGLFAYSGEGEQWERVETLTVNGDTMKRSSATPRSDATDALTYTRCKA